MQAVHQAGPRHEYDFYVLHVEHKGLLTLKWHRRGTSVYAPLNLFYTNLSLMNTGCSPVYDEEPFTPAPALSGQPCYSQRIIKMHGTVFIGLFVKEQTQVSYVRPYCYL